MRLRTPIGSTCTSLAFASLALVHAPACGESGQSGSDGSLSDVGSDTTAGAPKRIFVIGAFLGDLYTTDGVAGGDQRCNTEAEAAMLGGQWKAWLSTDSANAIDRITSSGPWYLPDRETLLFATRDDLATGPATAIDRDPTGQPVDTTMPIWTGTSAAGTVASTTCENWTTPENVTGRAGRMDATSPAWTDDMTLGCGTYAGLYCFEL